MTVGTSVFINADDGAPEIVASENYVKNRISTSYITAGQKAGTKLGTNATAEGTNTTSSGNSSHAEGMDA